LGAQAQLDVAADHPLVLYEPAPMETFACAEGSRLASPAAVSRKPLWRAFHRLRDALLDGTG